MLNIQKKYIYYIILKWFIFIIFVTYWAATVLYCTPTNYVRIQLINYEDIFESVFYQKWTFFTPPPKANERLYFLFLSKGNDNKIISSEVFGLIRAKKRENPIFDTESEALDGIMTSSAYSLNNLMADKITILQKAYPDSSNIYIQNEINNLFINPTMHSTYFKTLKNYALEICKKNNLKPEDYLLKIRMTSIDIPSFKDRFDENLVLKEKTVFETYPVPV